MALLPVSVRVLSVTPAESQPRLLWTVLLVPLRFQPVMLRLASPGRTRMLWWMVLLWEDPESWMLEGPVLAWKVL